MFNSVKQGAKSCYVNSRFWWRKYFSEVGYVRREFNRLGNILRHYHEFKKRRMLARKFTTKLNSVQDRIIRELQSDGFSKTESHSLGIDTNILNYCRLLSEGYVGLTIDVVRERRGGKSKDYWYEMEE